jgi:hypothetical protein
MPRKLYQLVPIILLLSGVTAAGLAQSPPAGDGGTGMSKPAVRQGFSLFQKKNAETTDSNVPGKNKKGNPSPFDQDQAAPLSRETELDTLFRREAVCLRLQEIALRTGDDKLWRRADELLALARQAYTQKVAERPASSTGPLTDDMRNGQGPEPAGSLRSSGSGSGGPFTTRKAN